MSGDGNGSYWCNNQRADYLRTTHQHVLQSHGSTYLEGSTDRLIAGFERAWPSLQTEHVGAPKQEVEHENSSDQTCYARSNSSSHNTHVEHVDEEIVEYHVHHTHADVQHGWNLHVARAFQHGACQAFHLEEDATDADDGEI